MTYPTPLAYLLTGVLLATVSTAFAQDESSYSSYVLGPRYSVRWTDAVPDIRWDDAPAGDRFVVTAPGLGYVVGEGGAAQLLLDWRAGRQRLVDRAYAGASFFAWGLDAVREGEPFDPAELRSERSGEGPEAPRPADAQAPVKWTGTRTVRLSNPGHEMVFVITPDGATATDNGAPLALTGGGGNYRARGDDFEVGVSVLPDGYVYHYYRPR